MRTAYTKLWSGIVSSTIWSEDNPTRIVWITMLALADQHGEVSGSEAGLARIANVTLDECRHALTKFLAPEQSNHDDGRRIEAIEHGWRLLNYGKYRLLASRDEAKLNNAERQRRWRERQGVTVTKRDDCVTEDNACHDKQKQKQKQKQIAEAESPPLATLAGSPKGSRRQAAKDDERVKLPIDWRPSQTCQDHARDQGLDPGLIAEGFCDYFCEGRGRNEKRTISGWDRRWRAWCNADAARRPMKLGNHEEERVRKIREALANGR